MRAGEKLLTIQPGETAEMVSSVNCDVTAYIDGNYIGGVPTWNRSSVHSPFVVAGPASIKGTAFEQNPPIGFATFRILPDVADPATTLILPPGTNSVVLQLQSSTNLVDWSAAATVTLTNVPAALFVRAKLVETP